MKVSTNNLCNNDYPISKLQGSYNNRPAFEGAKSRKFLNTLVGITNFRKVKITFQDMVDAYKELGYDVILKRGSHAIVQIDNSYNLPLIIPHGKDKYVSPFDVKRLKLISLGKFEEAKRV